MPKTTAYRCTIDSWTHTPYAESLEHAACRALLVWSMHHGVDNPSAVVTVQPDLDTEPSRFFVSPSITAEPLP